MSAEVRFDDLELQQFMEKLLEMTGYDYRDYSIPSLTRRLQNIMRVEGVDELNKLQEKVFAEPEFQFRFLQSLSVPTTSMFRDPQSFARLRQTILPSLKDRPLIRIWSAGCSSGEEAYSLAIVLKEEGLYERARVYATDVSDSLLEKAKSGVFPLRSMRDYTNNYLEAGGTREFSSYYTSGYDKAIFDQSLSRNMVFAQHNLVTDSSFNEFDLILCRNVLIYFNRVLQNRVFALLHQSLPVNGYLVLGAKETIRFSDHYQNYEANEKSFRLFKRIS